jgi:hypothetical protein
MKTTRISIIIFSLFFIINTCLSYPEHVHQYIIRNAYSLLQYQLGYAVPIMSNRVGYMQEGTGPFNPGGLLVIGGYREDHDDVIFGWEGIWEWRSTMTHFWKADNSDEHTWNYGGLGTYYANAFQKVRKFFYGGYSLKY